LGNHKAQQTSPMRIHLIKINILFPDIQNTVLLQHAPCNKQTLSGEHRSPYANSVTNIVILYAHA